MTVLATEHVPYFKQAVLDLSPVLYLRCDEASGDLSDMSRNRHTATAFGGITYEATGLTANDTNKAVTLNGSTGYFTVADHSSLDVLDDLTLLFAAKRSVSGTGDVVFAKGVNAYLVMLNGSNRLEFQKQQSSIIVTSTTNVLATDTARLFAVTKTGSTVKLYRDGADETGTVTNATLVNTATDLNIGRSSESGGVNYFAGTLDELVILNYALSAAQVLHLYRLWAGNYSLASTSLGTAATVSPTAL